MLFLSFVDVLKRKDNFQEGSIVSYMSNTVPGMSSTAKRIQKQKKRIASIDQYKKHNN